jgi:uncharacterized membrane protein
MTKNRLEAFSDGVIAIAITLLVLELRPPDLEAGETLLEALWHEWPSYVAYVVAFAQLGVIWLNHHRLFQQVQRVDGPLLLLNLNLLLWVVLIPFPTSVVAAHLGDGGEPARTAVAFLAATFLVTAISFCALFLWVTREGTLVAEPPSPAVRRAARVRFSIGLGAYLVAFLVALVTPWLSLAIQLAVALYYAFDQATVVRDATAPPVLPDLG